MEHAILQGDGLAEALHQAIREFLHDVWAIGIIRMSRMSRRKEDDKFIPRQTYHHVSGP